MVGAFSGIHPAPLTKVAPMPYPLRPHVALALVVAACATSVAACKAEQTCGLQVTIVSPGAPTATRVVFQIFGSDGRTLLLTRTHLGSLAPGRRTFALLAIDAKLAGAVQVSGVAYDASNCPLVSSPATAATLAAGKLTSAAMDLVFTTGSCGGGGPDGAAGDDGGAEADGGVDGEAVAADAGADGAYWTPVVSDFLASDEPSNPTLAPLSATQTYLAWTRRRDNGFAIGASNEPMETGLLPNLPVASTIYGGAALVRDDSSTPHPYVAWAADGQILVDRLDGTTWSPLGAPLVAATGDNSPAACAALVFDAAGAPTVAWTQGATRAIYFRRWTGQAWASAFVSGLHDPAGPGLDQAACPRLVSGGPATAAAWVEGKRVFVRKWTGADWSPVGAGLDANPAAEKVTLGGLAVDAGGNPIVAWQEAWGTKSTSSVRRWQVDKWVAIDESSLPVLDDAAASGPPALAMDGAGTPWLAWFDIVNGHLEVRVSTLMSDRWQATGRTLRGQGTPGELALSVAGSVPFVAFIDVRPTGRALYSYSLKAP
jgi:hypothetical protein